MTLPIGDGPALIERLRPVLQDLAVHMVRRDMPAIESEPVSEPFRWNFLLLAASALTASGAEAAQDAALRIAQACISEPGATLPQREAAGLLLKRLGNMPALALARKRELLDSVGGWSTVPLDLAIDAGRRQWELEIELSDGQRFAANPFQREFWDLVRDHAWVSVSAPTSAGKTRIVRAWIGALFGSRERFTAVYVAPTRALVQEVSQSLANELGSEVHVHTLPWDGELGREPREMYVVTQERMHLLQQRDSSFMPHFIFVDEAQNVGDGSRGILLSAVLDEAIERNPLTQLVFASPLTSNPDALLVGAPAESRTVALVSETVTVNQNLLLVEQVRGKPSRFRVELSAHGGPALVGEFSIAASRATPAQRPAFVAAALGGDSGNIIYANGPAAAEKLANLLFDILGPEAESTSGILAAAADYIRSTVHDKFALATVIERGVGYHYGDIPLPIKTLIEDLFRSGHLKYLVCTSTLLEGVNLPCRNIFIRGPRKGISNPMTPSDFWNLGGRAGRWGDEFQGNVVCIDVRDQKQWPTPPGPRVRGVIRKAAEEVIGERHELLNYIAGGGKPSGQGVPERLEAAYSFVASRRLADRSIDDLHGLAGFSEGLAELHAALDHSLEGLSLPVSVVRRHAGISPASMERLYRAVVNSSAPQDLLLVVPEADEAKAVYKTALDLIAEHLGGPFADDRRRFALANLVVNWMNGIPLSRLIDYRIRWLRDNRRDAKPATTIRQVMADVEKIARFSAPKYLACFNDIVLFRLGELGIQVEDAPDVAMMLELGVPRVTDMGLINAGLSRASAMAVSPFISTPDLDGPACLVWLRERDIETLDLPAFAHREIAALLASERTVIGEV